MSELMNTHPFQDQPKLGIQVDLRTPFVVKEIKNQQERILYYEVNLSSVFIDENDPAQGRERRLVVKPKTKQTESVVLTNTVTNQDTEMVVLRNNVAKSARRAVAITPDDSRASE